MTVRPPSAIPRRVRLEAAAHLVRDARVEVGMTKIQVASIQNVNPNVIARYEDEEDHRSIAPLDLALDPSALGKSIRRRLCEANGEVVVDRTPGTAASWWSLHGDALESASAFSIELARALSPGGDGAEDLTNGELQALRAKHLELERIVAAIDATLRQREQESASTCGRARVTPIERRRG